MQYAKCSRIVEMHFKPTPIYPDDVVIFGNHGIKLDPSEYDV